MSSPRRPKGLTGGEIDFPKVTVGGTHTAMMAAATAHGSTLHRATRRASRRSRISPIASIKMGARIQGAGTPTIEIAGVARLNGAHHRVLPDRIEAGTYATAVAMTGGDILLEGVGPDLFQEALDALAAPGATVTSDNRGVRVTRNGAGIGAVDISTAPFPGFPTDLQAQFMALMTRARGVSRITETIFENRFMHVQELARLGARIKLDGDTAVVEGVDTAARRAGDGDRSARFGFAGDRGARGGRRNDRQSRLPPRPRFRAPRTKARRLRRRHRRELRAESMTLASTCSSSSRSTARVSA